MSVYDESLKLHEKYHGKLKVEAKVPCEDAKDLSLAYTPGVAEPCRKIHEETGISENDIAKRLMDYGYHAPTLSFPVHGTLMIEPTESESFSELENFVKVMLNIWEEIQEVKEGKADKEDNVLVNAPHPEYEVVANNWEHSYTREKAAYPIESVRENKFWINVARVDNTLGDRKLLPTCYGCFG